KEILTYLKPQPAENRFSLRLIVDIGSKRDKVICALELLLERRARVDVVENDGVVDGSCQKGGEVEVYLGVPRPFFALPVQAILTEVSALAKKPQHGAKNAVSPVLDVN